MVFWCSGSLGWMFYQVQSPVLAFRCLVHVPCHFIIVKYLSSSNCKQLRTRPYCFLVFCMIFFRHSITTGMKRRRHRPRPSCPIFSPRTRSATSPSSGIILAMYKDHMGWYKSEGYCTLTITHLWPFEIMFMGHMGLESMIIFRCPINFSTSPYPMLV